MLVQVLHHHQVNFMFMVYDFQTKKTDTVYDVRGIVEVQFNVKGKYKMYLKVWNRCEKCDTALYRPLEIVQFPGANVSFKPLSQDCKKYMFAMNYIKGMPAKDTCMMYYMVFYKGPWMDTMSQKEWDNLTDYQIGMEYDFPDADFLGYTQTPTETILVSVTPTQTPSYTPSVTPSYTPSSTPTPTTLTGNLLLLQTGDYIILQDGTGFIELQ